MANAYILKNGNIVQSDGWEDIIISVTTGFLVGFTKVSTGTEYIHINEKDFRKEDQGWFSGGYYPKEDFLNYLPTRDIDLIDYRKKYSHPDNHKFKYAVLNDTITIKKIDVTTPIGAPGGTSPYIKISTFLYDPNLSYFNGTSIRIPQSLNVQEEVEPISLISAASGFVANNTDNAITNTTFSDENKKEAITYLGLTAIVIQRIIQKIFSLFPNEPTYNDLIENQKIEWASFDSTIFSETSSLKDYKDYFNSIYNFYRTSYRNSVKITNAPSDEKLFWIALPLTTKTLSIIDIEGRKSIIDLLLDKKLSKNFKKIEEEELLIRIVNSFAFNSDFTIIDAFLEWLLTEKETISGSEIDETTYRTYYEVLYRSMSSPFNITVSTIALSNWLFEETWEPDNTRDHFVKIVYKLWTVSKFNPYELNGALKPNSIGMIARDGDNIVYELDATPPSIPIDFEDEGQDVILSTSPPNPEPLHYYTKYPAYEITEMVVDDLGVQGVGYLYNTKFGEAAPAQINYESRKSIGLFIDNLEFKFSNEKILVSKEVPIFSRTSMFGSNQETTRYAFKHFGSYNIFQPVTLLQNDTRKLETKVPIPLTSGETVAANGENINSVVPVFMLMYVDEVGDSSDTETVLGYVVDGLLTLSGIGNLTKLRHLTQLSKLQYVKRIIGGVEFFSGVLSYLVNFIGDCDDDDEFCKSLKAFTFWLEMASLSADAITEYMLRKAARNVKNIGYPTDFHPTSKDKIDDLAIVNVVEKAAEIQRFLNAIDINLYPQLKNKLEALRVDLGDDIVFEFIDHLDANDATLKILNDNILENLADGTPSWLDDITDVDKAKKLARVASLLGKSKATLLRNIDLANGPNPTLPLQFDLIHTDLELKSIIEKAIELDLPQVEIDGFLFVSCRKFNASGAPKEINAVELRNQMDNWIQVRINDFPYKFNTVADFTNFRTQMIDQLDELGIPSNSTYIQGSALRTASAKDVDVAIRLTLEQMTEVKTKIISRYEIDYIDIDTGLIREDAFNNAVARLDSDIEKGLIKSRQFGKKDGKSFQQEFRDPPRNGYYDGKPLDISIVIIDEKFDMPPYLKL